MERRLRRRHEVLAADLVRGAGPGNVARHAAAPTRFAARGAALALLAVACAGCSLSVPLTGGKTDDVPTGSVDRTVALLSPSLDREDLRRARAAMAVALDPQGDGGRTGWQNPGTGAHGGFAASAPPYVDHDRVCRRFSSDAVTAGGSVRRLSGAACREGDGTWRVLSSEGDGA